MDITDFVGFRKVGNDAFDYIYSSLKDSIDNGRVLCIGKIGAIELNIIYQTLLMKNKLITEYNPVISFEAIHTAGMHPHNDETFKEYTKIFLETIKDVNILASWNDNLINVESAIWYNYILPRNINNADEIKGIVELISLEPFYTSPNYWWQNLYKNKTILVITPFVESIKTQLDNRDLVWNGKWHNFWDKSITFKFIKSLHPFAISSEQDKQHYPCNIPNILSKYYTDIDNIGEFDIALVGVGCYSIPICSYIKTHKNKTSYHLGGGLQMMFGVYGNRWIHNSNPLFKEYINKHWIRPLPSEIPPGYKNQEQGAYY